ncbi:MAG: SCP-like protein extracellular [Candidatus Gottesmanbacteria bacterium GW2011_GWA2_41_12]|uniref:SCP-like protein extracellular n=1 Tax=Candidatus Gottesmanbacteria bacterium GW2011_GWA2_41_12 TaxID=1618440 RepID=A0A0G0ULP1_9BACT|nr:MAG: SCP-like protein extracellular [Candidatus Gottesmanbacteria bacterium GW2011_GWA2_41_12]
MKNAGIFYTEAGENLAFAPNVNIAHAGLMNSPGHRANILSPDFGKVGIGVIDGGIYGEMFVQKFTD